MKTVKDLRTFHGSGDAFRILMDSRQSGGYRLVSLFLSVDSNQSAPVPTNSLNLLRTLHIDYYHGTFSLELLASILLSTPRALRKVAIYVKKPKKYPSDPLLRDKEAVEYTELDNVLCRSFLDEFKITVCLYGKGVLIETRNRWEQWLAAMLPRFCASEGKLQVTRSSTLVDPQLRWEDNRDGFYDLGN